MRERLTVLAVVLVLSAARAFALAPGEALPGVRIALPGELHIAGDKLDYAPWDSSMLTGKLHIVQYLAARWSARDINRPFTDRLEASGIPLERYQLTTIVNLDDAMFGTRSMVLAELESSKRRYFRSSIVADAEGVGRATWGLTGKSSAILVLDSDGRVVFFRDGALSAAEIEQVLEMVRGGG